MCNSSLDMLDMFGSVPTDFVPLLCMLENSTKITTCCRVTSHCRVKWYFRLVACVMMVAVMVLVASGVSREARPVTVCQAKHVAGIHSTSQHYAEYYDYEPCSQQVFRKYMKILECFTPSLQWWKTDSSCRLRNMSRISATCGSFWTFLISTATSFQGKSMQLLTAGQHVVGAWGRNWLHGNWLQQLHCCNEMTSTPTPRRVESNTRLMSQRVYICGLLLFSHVCLPAMHP